MAAAPALKRLPRERGAVGVLPFSATKTSPGSDARES